MQFAYVRMCMVVFFTLNRSFSYDIRFLSFLFCFDFRFPLLIFQCLRVAGVHILHLLYPLCFVFTLNRYFHHTRRQPAHPESALILHPQDTTVPWHDTILSTTLTALPGMM